MSNGQIPVPSIEFFPKIMQDYPDAGTIALSEKIDYWLLQIEAVIDELRYFLNPERILSQFLGVEGIYLAASLFAFDDDITKRRKIANAVQSHKLRTTWDFDVKVKIDIVAGGDSQIVSTGHEDNFDFIWLTGDSSEYHAETQHSLWDSGDEGYGMLWITGDTEPEVPGNIYIDVDNPYMTQQQIDALILFLQDSIASYFNTFLGIFYNNFVAITSGTSATLNGAAYLNGVNIIVGASAIIISYNATSWELVDTAFNYKGVTWGNGTYLAVGSGGCRISTNAISWSTTSTGISFHNWPSYGNSKFIIVANDGKIVESTDASDLSWTQVTSGTSNDLNSVVFGNGNFVAVGDGGVITTSPDYNNWTLRTSGTGQNLLAVTYGNGKFVAVGTSDTVVISDDDGVTWSLESTSIGTTLYSIDYDSDLNIFMVVGDNPGKIMSSRDLQNWTLHDTAANQFHVVAYNNDLKRHIAAGLFGYVVNIFFNKFHLA